MIGAQIGTAAGGGWKAEQLRFGLACIVLLVCARIGWELVATPSEFFSIENSVPTT